jgi:GNAT superfamily N-acetyltransferase
MNTRRDALDSETMWVDDTPLTVRPIEITDVDRLARFFDRLSPESIHFRFFSPVRKPPRTALLRLADVDHSRREALVALDGDEIVAVARYDATDEGHAEIAITVEDAWQHRGVGKRLTKRLARVASDRGYAEFTATMLPDNRRALGLMHRLSPETKVVWARGEYEAHMPLPHAS